MPSPSTGRASAADTFIYSTSNATADYGSIAIFGSVTQNSGNVTVRHYGSYGNGIYSGNSITVNGGTLDVKSDQKNGLSIYNSITINGGTVTANGKRPSPTAATTSSPTAAATSSPVPSMPPT